MYSWLIHITYLCLYMHTTHEYFIYSYVHTMIHRNCPSYTCFDIDMFCQYTQRPPGVVVSGTGLQLAPQGVWPCPQRVLDPIVWNADFSLVGCEARQNSAGMSAGQADPGHKPLPEVAWATAIDASTTVEISSHEKLNCWEWCPRVPVSPSCSVNGSRFPLTGARKKILRPVAPHYDDKTHLRTCRKNISSTACWR